MINKHNNIIDNLSFKELNRKFSFRAKKSLGQNFLIDENLCNKIVSSLSIVKNYLASEEGNFEKGNDKNKYSKFINIIEIGPGPASLSKHIFNFIYNIKAAHRLFYKDNIDYYNKSYLIPNIFFIEKDESFNEVINYVANSFNQAKYCSEYNYHSIRRDSSEVSFDDYSQNPTIFYDVINQDALKLDLENIIDKYGLGKNHPPHYLNHHSRNNLHTTSTITHKPSSTLPQPSLTPTTPHYLNHHSQKGREHG
ncbi:MAG TPA: rRNA adenine N-6-methyltransferase family protein [Candidatus Megaira endosymbiont of Hartmannula sinica]|nr:rRNA adenine N-6-methyltransferase family protein [Candidatus Megaera endosymbiont of Hartmannula sinica]